MLIKVGKHSENNSEYIGRSSPLGNPYIMMDNSKIERNRVCDLYELWFNEKIQKDDPVVMKELDRLYKIAGNNNLILGCFCSPLRCHGETIKNYLLLKLL